MKSPKLFVASLALLTGLASPFLRAQPSDAPSTKEHAGPRGGGMGPDLKAIAEKLELTEDQKAKAKPIIEDEKKALEALRADTSLERPAKRAKAMEIHRAHADQFRALLTPEQVTKLDAMKDEMKEKGRERMKEHKEKAPASE
jgi:Spy/CpxP family protein refolding chaperone